MSGHKYVGDICYAAQWTKNDESQLFMDLALPNPRDDLVLAL